MKKRKRELEKCKPVDLKMDPIENIKRKL